MCKLRSACKRTKLAVKKTSKKFVLICHDGTLFFGFNKSAQQAFNEIERSFFAVSVSEKGDIEKPFS